MVLRYARATMLVCVFALAACGGGGGVGDAGSSGSTPGGGDTGSNPPPPPPPAGYPDIPATDADAARFLTQATFGPTHAEIANLRKIGYRAWLEEQLSEVTAPPTSILQDLEQMDVVLGPKHRRNDWLWKATTAHDQLRLRMGFALSQILVVSDLDFRTNGNAAIRLADYQDLVDREAFGSYRKLLEDVTLHPATGIYLTYLGNGKADSVSNITPDENYAREIMQLFSIGLVKRNRDFTPILDNQGNTIPTYDQDVVSAMARVLTGWTYAGHTDAGFRTFDDFSNGPMECHPVFHDSAPKTIFDGIVINKGDDCTADLALMLDALANHPNTAPFVSRQLIQRFVTSSPSPAYVGRVVDAWDASGGNLGEVLRAILLDVEARISPAETDAIYGKGREPLIKIATLWRAFNATYVPPDTNEIKFLFEYSGDLTVAISQDSLRAPSVFNFFAPDYQLQAADGVEGILAPEFQILNESTFLGALRLHDDLIWWPTADQPPPPHNGPILDLSTLIAQAEAQDYAGMVQEVNLLLYYGTLSAHSQEIMVNLLEQLGATGRTPSECARSLVELAFDSPEFAVQR